MPSTPLESTTRGIAAAGLHGGARIRRINPRRIAQLLSRGVVPVVTGFQGWRRGRVATLHRGGTDTSAIALAAAAVAFWYACIILPAWEHPFAANLGNVDFFTQIYPMSVRGAALFREGTFPLWNPFQFAGHPFLATALYGVCYPPNVVYLLLPTALAIEGVVVLHLALAGWFTYLYASAVGIRR